MAVNTEIWGAPETWRELSSSSYAYLSDFKRPKNGVNSYSDLYRNDVLQGGDVPTDLSISFWGINKNSILAHPVYLSSYWDGDEIKTAVNRVTDKAETVPCILNYSGDPGLSVNTNWYYRYAPTDNPGESAWSKNDVVYNTRYKREIAISFNYQKILLVPWVRIALENPVDSWGYQVVKLKDYIDNRATTYANYNKIVGIGYRIALGDTNRSENNTGIGFVIPSNYEASEREYIGDKTYKWFATKYGYYTLSTNGVIGNNNTRSITPYNTDETSVSPVDFSSLHTVGDPDTGFRYKYCKNYGSNYGQVPIYYYDTDEPLWKVNAYTPWNTNYAHPFPYIECTTANINEVRDYVLTQIAYLGFPFVYDYEKARYGQIGDEGVFLPVFDDKGVTTGEYKEGRAAIRLPNSDWVDGRESGFDPYTPEPSEDGDTGDLNNFPTFQNRYANANAVYALDESNFIKFVGDVNNLYLTDTDDTRLKLDFKGSNPNDYIIGVYGVPFLCNYIVPSGGDTSINLGPVTLPTAQGKKVDTSTTLMRDCGTVTIPAKGNFLDYEPYTQIELYIPMCGTIQLDCAQVVGRTLHVIVYYDITTMACVGCVYRNAPEGETLIHTINGTIGASLPLTSARMGDYQNSVQTTKNALKQNEMRTALGVGGAVIGIAGAALAPETGGLSLALAGAAIGGLATAAGGAMTEKQLQYDLTHKQPALSQCSAADGMTAQLVSNLRPWIFIKRAKELPSYDATTYGKTVGFACCINSTVGAFSGFTVYSNVDLSGIPATKTEIDMIRAKLNSGVYI